MSEHARRPEIPVRKEPTMPRAVPLRAGEGCCWQTWTVKDAAYWAAMRAGTPIQCDAPRVAKRLADGSVAPGVYCADHEWRAAHGPAGRGAAA